MRLIAHRGFAGLHPENTLGAVREAVALADEVEIDVRRCETGELVVIHDPTVDRVTDGSGAVAHHTLRELRELNVLGTGEGVPTLEEVFDVVPPGVGVNVELKEVGLAHDALTLAREHHPQVTVSSFHANELEGCRGASCEVPRAYLFASDPEQAFTFAHDIDCSYLHPAAEVCDEWLVDRAHAEGLCVNAWTVDERAEAERLEALGVDGVIADRWCVLPEARQRQ
ncbi:glycerophosphodiester phosphodiesterase [Natronomonas sp. EA1]|uniref:glycerophosphodiester phosphodiesterase n=1 Tax=Natronomonas sp. EA1 TaxID=3421655 RepID=UPI003EC0BF86